MGRVMPCATEDRKATIRNAELWHARTMPALASDLGMSSVGREAILLRRAQFRKREMSRNRLVTHLLKKEKNSSTLHTTCRFSISHSPKSSLQTQRINMGVIRRN